jgi:hypothetical protein
MASDDSDGVLIRGQTIARNIFFHGELKDSICLNHPMRELADMLTWRDMFDHFEVLGQHYEVVAILVEN